MGICPTRCRSNMTILENSPESETTDQQEDVIVALYDYPTFGNTALTMKIGEKLSIVTDDGDFMMVRSTATGLESYIPSNYTATVTQRWLFKGIGRDKAVELLMHPYNQNGAFLIRESETNTDCYSLSILRRSSSSYLNGVKHYRISQLRNGWVHLSAQLTFPSLYQLVEHYSDSADGLCCRLTAPCFIQGLDNALEPMVIRRPTINWKDISRSLLLKRKRTEPDNCLVSEGLREAISSYLQMTEVNDWDT